MSAGRMLFAVESEVYQAVGLGVLLAAHVADRPGVEIAERLLHPAMKLAHRRVLDLVLALHLLDDQLGVADQLELVGAVLRGALDAEQQRPVLGDVVGGLADPLAALLEHGAVGRAHHGRDRRRARIPPGPAVDVDDEPQRRLSQRRRGEAATAPKAIRAPGPSKAFQCRAARSSCCTSVPLATSATVPLLASTLH